MPDSVPNLRFYLLDPTGLYYKATQNQDGTWAIETTNVETWLEVLPRNWQDIEITWKRSTTYWGTFPSVSTNIEFVKDGAAILRSLFYKKWVQAQCTIIIKAQVNTESSPGAGDALRYDTLYETQLDFSQSNDAWEQLPTGNVFTISAFDSEISRLLSAYGDTSYNLNFGKMVPSGDTATFVPSNGQWLCMDGINLYFNSTFSGPVDATAGTTFLISSVSHVDNGYRSIFAFNQVGSVNTPIGNQILTNDILVGFETPITCGTNPTSPFFEPYNKQSYLFKIPNSVPNYFILDALMQTQISITAATPSGTDTLIAEMVIWEMDFNNNLTSGNVTTSGLTVFKVIIDSGFGSGFFCPPFNIGSANATLPAGVTVVYPHGTTDSPYTAPLTLNPGCIYISGIRLTVMGSGDWNAGDIKFGCNGSGMNYSFYGPVIYPQSASSFMRLHEVWEAIVPLLANTQGNYGYPGIALDSFSKRITAKSDFLRYDTTSVDPPPYSYQYWNNNPFNTVIATGTALRCFQVVANNKIVSGPGFPNAYGIPVSDGVNPPYILPITGPDFAQNAPYATIQGPYAATNPNEVFKACDSMYGMALWFERDGDGDLSIMRMEPRQAVFDSSLQLADLGSVINLSITPYSDVAANTLNIGYKNNNFNQSYGIDESNLSQTRKMPTTLVASQKVCDKTNPWNASTYLIEGARSNAQANAQIQFNSDNDINIISIDPTNTVTMPGPTLGATITAMRPKRYTGYNGSIDTEVYNSGLFYPGTIEYNEDLSPMRCFLRQKNWFAAMTYGANGQNITFQSYSIPSYVGLSVQLDGTAPIVSEWADVPVDSLGQPLFLPFMVEFDSPTPIELNKQLAADANGYYKFMWRNIDWKMFPMEAGIYPGKNATFKFKGLLTPDTDLNKLIYLLTDISVQ